MTDIAAEKNDLQQDLVLHCCAIFGTRRYYAGYPATFEWLKESIVKSVADGYFTFFTSANDGYELDAARFILSLKKKDSRICLVIVIPAPNRKRSWKTLMLFEDVCKNADYVKVISKTDDIEATDKATKWMLSNCRRVITATSSPNSGINRLSGFDLSSKECLKVSVVWSEADSAFVRELPQTLRKDDAKADEQWSQKFPYNLLSELLGAECVTESQFPYDVTDCLFTILSKYDERTQQIMMLRYLDRLTLQQIGEHYGVSRERVRQIIQKGLRRLKYNSHMNVLVGLEENDATAREQGRPEDSDSSNKLNRWTTEEIEQLKEDIFRLHIDQVALKYCRSASSVAYVIKTHNLMPVEQYAVYCYSSVQRKIIPDKISNTGEKWTASEEERLLSLYNSGTPIAEIAEIHKRTIGGIVARLARLIGVDRDQIMGTAAEASTATDEKNTSEEVLLPSSETMSISELARLLSLKTKKLHGVTLRYADIAEWLIASGDLVDDYSDEKTIRTPTLQGRQRGIMRGERINSSGVPYVGVYLEPAGQQYIIENLDCILRFLARKTEKENITRSI